MSDDTRQARIDAALTAWAESYYGGNDYMTMKTLSDEQDREAITSAILAADAVGRERVSEAEARTLIRYLLGERIELFVTPVEDERRADLERIHNERIEHIVALLVAAPAERGDETGGVKP